MENEMWQAANAAFDEAARELEARGWDAAHWAVEALRLPRFPNLRRGAFVSPDGAVVRTLTLETRPWCYALRCDDYANAGRALKPLRCGKETTYSWEAVMVS